MQSRGNQPRTGNLPASPLKAHLRHRPDVLAADFDAAYEADGEHALTAQLIYPHATPTPRRRAPNGDVPAISSTTCTRTKSPHATDPLVVGLEDQIHDRFQGSTVRAAGCLLAYRLLSSTVNPSLCGSGWSRAVRSATVFGGVGFADQSEAGPVAPQPHGQ